jgi:hypothetical protein
VSGNTQLCSASRLAICLWSIGRFNEITVPAYSKTGPQQLLRFHRSLAQTISRTLRQRTGAIEAHLRSPLLLFPVKWKNPILAILWPLSIDPQIAFLNVDMATIAPSVVTTFSIGIVRFGFGVYRSAPNDIDPRGGSYRSYSIERGSSNIRKDQSGRSVNQTVQAYRIPQPKRTPTQHLPPRGDSSSLPPSITSESSPSTTNKTLISHPTVQTVETSVVLLASLRGQMSGPKFASAFSSPDTFTLPAISTSKFTELPSSILRKKELRKRYRESRDYLWEFQDKRLNKLVTPEDNCTRNDPEYRCVFDRESQLQKNSYIRDPVQSASEKGRFWHMSYVRIRRAYDRAHELRRRKAARKVREELYKLAYLKFKKAKCEKYERMGFYEKALEKGWSAKKEWRDWQRMVNMYKHTGWGRSKGVKYVTDDFQRRTERRIFDITARKPESVDK